MEDEHLRTFDFGELLDGAFTLYRRNFSYFFNLALIPQVPLILFWIFAPILFGASSSPQTMSNIGSLITMPYAMFAYPLTWGALTWGVWRAYVASESSIGEAFGVGLRRWLPIVIVLILYSLLFMLGMILLVIPALVVIATLFAILPATVIERRGPFAAIGRSRRLSKGGRLRIFGAVLVAYLITLLPIIAMSMIAGVGFATALGGASPGIFDGPWPLAIVQATTVVISAITWPLLIIVTVLLYVDRRARTEAPELEAAAASLLAEA